MHRRQYIIVKKPYYTI